jgi:4a-hydroxytetrahydrobiopterin dehydratase
MATLESRQCQALPAGTAPLARAEIDALLTGLPGWTYADGAISKTFSFADFHQTMAFVNALAWIAHRQDHHPDLAVSYNRCSVRYNTHSIGGVSANDFICAARIEALFR